MAGASSYFTAINCLDDASAPKPVLSPVNPPPQPANPGPHAARRRRRDPLVKEYLSSGKSGSKESMFERAALSHGESPQKKKRRTGKSSETEAKQQSPLRMVSSGRSRTAGRRAMSEGVLITGPGAFPPMRPQGPAFNPRAAANRQLLQNDVDDRKQANGSANKSYRLAAPHLEGANTNVMRDNISLVAPLTSMDTVSAHPISSMTFAKESNFSGKDAHGSSSSSPIYDLDVPNRPADSFLEPRNFTETATQDQTLCRATKIEGGNRKPSRSSGLGSVVEETLDDLDYPGDLTTQQRNIDATTAGFSGGLAYNNNAIEDFDIFYDDLSEADLIRCLEDTTRTSLKPQSSGPSSPTAVSQKSSYLLNGEVRPREDGAFDDDLSVLGSDDLNTLEQGPASMDSATILNQVSSNIPKVRASPVALAPTEIATADLNIPAMKPILRPPFPARVTDRPSIIGVSATLSLRTCFRIGEALNVGSQAVREHRSVLVELYARVRWSFREPRSAKQHFTLMDLFHDRPPYIEGTYESWKGVELFERDCGRFLERPDRPLICRSVGKLRREGTSWKLMIVSIWEATMDDVEHVAEIIQS